MEKIKLNSINKNEMDLSNRKMKNHPSSPTYAYNSSTVHWGEIQDHVR